jgi:hypothetical protein
MLKQEASEPVVDAREPVLVPAKEHNANMPLASRPLRVKTGLRAGLVKFAEYEEVA